MRFNPFKNSTHFFWMTITVTLLLHTANGVFIWNQGPPFHNDLGFFINLGMVGTLILGGWFHRVFPWQR